mmetsp:Transcript_6724/g.41077  ORF Transcript_6724/g.41077 Transcript_6724/m.41077 type:complete len:204 (+) Transcript_6724:4997-5608(+)
MRCAYALARPSKPSNASPHSSLRQGTSARAWWSRRASISSSSSSSSRWDPCAKRGAARATRGRGGAARWKRRGTRGTWRGWRRRSWLPRSGWRRTPRARGGTARRATRDGFVGAGGACACGKARRTQARAGCSDWTCTCRRKGTTWKEARRRRSVLPRCSCTEGRGRADARGTTRPWRVDGRNKASWRPWRITGCIRTPPWKT